MRKDKTRGDGTLGPMLDLLGGTAMRKAGFLASPLEEDRMFLFPNMSIL